MNFVRSLTLGLTLLAFAGRPAVAADPLPPLLVDEAGSVEIPRNHKLALARALVAEIARRLPPHESR
mgnify:CR=1 FL=1